MDVFRKCAVVESMLIGKPKLNEINVNSPPWNSLFSDNLARMVNLENDIDYQAIKKDVLDFVPAEIGYLMKEWFIM